MGDQQVRVEELLVFRADRTGLAQTESAISGLGKKLKDVSAEAGKVAKEETRHISDVIRNMMVVTGAKDAQARAMMTQVSLLREEGKQTREIIGEIKTKFNLSEKQADAAAQVVEENQKTVNLYREQADRVRDILGIKDRDLDLTKLSEAEIKKTTSELGAQSQLLLWGTQLKSKGVQTVTFEGMQLKKMQTTTEAINKNLGQWLIKLAKMNWGKALAVAAYGAARHMGVMVGYTELVKQHVQDTAMASVVTGDTMGELQAKFGISQEKAGDFVKQLAEAGLQAKEIGDYAQVIYAREMMWGIPAAEQVELMRKIQYNMKLTEEEADKVLNIAGATGKDLREWTIAEVVDQFGDMTKELRGAGFSTLQMFALFKAIAATDVTSGFKVFAGLSKESKKGIMESVAAFGEMSVAQLAIISQEYKGFPDAIKTTTDKIVFLREAFIGVATDGGKKVDSVVARTKALGSIFDFIGKKTAGTKDLSSKKLQVSYLLQEVMPKMDILTATELAATLGPALAKGLNSGEALKLLTKEQNEKIQKAIKDGLVPTDQQILKTAEATSIKMGGLLDAARRAEGYLGLLAAQTYGDPKARELKKAFDDYGEKGVTANTLLGVVFDNATGEMIAKTNEQMADLRKYNLVTKTEHTATPAQVKEAAEKRSRLSEPTRPENLSIGGFNVIPNMVDTPIRPQLPSGPLLPPAPKVMAGGANPNPMTPAKDIQESVIWVLKQAGRGLAAIKHVTTISVDQNLEVDGKKMAAVTERQSTKAVAGEQKKTGKQSTQSVKPAK